MNIAEAAAHLRALMASMYAGRSVRNPSEFKEDLKAIRIACEALEEDRSARWALLAGMESGRRMKLQTILREHNIEPPADPETDAMVERVYAELQGTQTQ